MISGTDLEQYLPKNFGLPENSPFLEKSPPNTAKPAPKTKPQTVRNAITKVLIFALYIIYAFFLFSRGFKITT